MPTPTSDEIALRIVIVPDWMGPAFDPTELTALEVSPALKKIRDRHPNVNAVVTQRLLAILRMMGQHIPQPQREECYRGALALLKGND